MSVVIKTIEELFSFARDFTLKLEPKKGATIIALDGDLGAGKTAFVKKVAEFLAIEEELTSPTFVIQKEYIVQKHSFFKKLIHIDAYRLEKSSDLEYLGWEENIQNPENIICIEWPSEVEGINMPEKIQVSIEIQSDKSRRITIK